MAQSRNNVLNRLFRWYFSKSALPYWCVLAIDCSVVFFFGLVSAYLRVGGNVFASNFWQLCAGMVMVVCCYVVGFRVYHTYSGIIRYSSFADLGNVGRAGLVGSVLAYALTLIFNHYVPLKVVVMPSLAGHFIIFVASVLVMWIERVVVKILYDLVRKSVDTERAMIYGIMDGGAAIARYITSMDPVQYDLKGFIAPYDSEVVPSVMIVIMAIYAVFMNRKMKTAFKENRKRIGVINGQIEDSLAGIRVVKSFANEEIENQNFVKFEKF